MIKYSILLKKKYCMISRLTGILSLIIVNYITTSTTLLDTVAAAAANTTTNNNTESNTTNNDIIKSTFTSNDNNVMINIQANTIQQQITFDMTYIGNPTWISIGFTTTGKMIGSTAVIGFNNDIQFYDMTSKITSGVTPIVVSSDTTTVLLSDTIFVQNTTHTYLKFTRPFSIGIDNIPDIYINSGNSNDNLFIYAYGYDNNGLGIHSDRQTFNVPLTSDNTGSTTIQVVETPYKLLWILHGLCMVFSWIILIPLGIGSSRLRTILFAKDSTVWFTIHRTMNMIGVVVTLIGFTIAVIATSKSNDQHFTSNIHQKIGLTVSILALLQAISGIVRPHPPSPKPISNTTTTNTATSTALTVTLDNNTTEYFVNDEMRIIENENTTNGNNENNKVSTSNETSSSVPTTTTITKPKTKQRLVWELFHHIIGASIVVVAIYNCYTGLDKYEIRYNTSYDTTLSIIIGCIFVPLLLLTLYVFVRDNFLKKQKEQYH